VTALFAMRKLSTSRQFSNLKNLIITSVMGLTLRNKNLDKHEKKKSRKGLKNFTRYGKGIPRCGETASDLT
jgi:hypothetical protein